MDPFPAVQTIVDDDVKEIARPSNFKIVLDSCFPEDIRKDQRGRYVLRHKGKHLRRGVTFKGYTPARVSFPHYKQLFTGAGRREPLPPILDHLDLLGPVRLPTAEESAAITALFRRIRNNTLMGKHSFPLMPYQREAMQQLNESLHPEHTDLATNPEEIQNSIATQNPDFGHSLMSQQEINLRLYQFNMTNDWSYLEGIPDSQQVSVMYPHVAAQMGETREHYEARLKTMFKIQD